MSYIAICFCNIVAFIPFAYFLRKGVKTIIFFSDLNLCKKSHFQKVQVLSTFQHLCNIVARKTFKKNENIFTKCLQISKLALPLLPSSHKQGTNIALVIYRKSLLTLQD